VRAVQAALLAAGYLVAWWLLSSAASRRHGGAVFVLGLALLAAAALAYRGGRRSWLLRLCYASALAAVAVLMIEAALHLRPGLLGGRVANFAYTGYHHYRGGIYDPDVEIGQRMRPRVRRWMFWNGHWWRHASNSGGWRGPDVDRAAAVFLGDSMIYGHGVEEPDTVPARFERHTGVRTANLGQQGTCAVQQLTLLRRGGRGLRPRVVFLCAHPTDLGDATRLYDERELGRLLEGSPPPPRVRSEYGPPSARDPLWLWARHLALPLWSGGVLGSLVRGVRERRLHEFTAARDPFVPTAAELDEVPPGLAEGTGAQASLAWRAHRQAVAEMRREAAAAGARVVLFDLGYPRPFTAAIERLAGELGVEYSPAGRVALQRALAGERVYLANDGHWTGRGAGVVAEELARTAAARDTVRD
jgi:hypothetical protein